MGRRDRRTNLEAALGLAICLALTPTIARAADAESGAGGPIRHASQYHAPPQEPTSFMNLGAGVYEPTDQPGDGFYGTIAGGSTIANQFDLGAQVSWYHRGSNSGSYVTTYVDPAGNTVERTVQTNAYDTDLIPLMAVARFHFTPSPNFQPYVGGAVGYEWLTVSTQGAYYYDPYGNVYYADTGITYGGWGGMALAGLNFGVTPATSLYGEISYNWSTVSADYYDPYYATSIRESINMDGAGFQGGLRFRF